jgi:hypothetical protein
MQTDHRTDQGVNADVAESLDAVESALSGANRLQAGPMPVVMISGAMYPGEPFWTDSKGRAAALNRWVAVIAKEVGKRFDTHSERSAAEDFARSHRLSIANFRA